MNQPDDRAIDLEPLNAAIDHQRDGRDREVRDRFARAGLSHLLDISCPHVAPVAGAPGLGK